MSVVGQIAELMPPPASPVVAPPWDEAPSEVGFAFPADYRDFVDLYGAGSINDEFIIEMPTLHPAGSGLRSGFRGFVDQATAFLANGLGEKSDGLLEWGYNQYGEMCFWDTRDSDPDRWTVVAFFLSSGKWERFDGGMAEFVLAALQGHVPFAEHMFRLSAGQPEWHRYYDWTG